VGVFGLALGCAVAAAGAAPFVVVLKSGGVWQVVEAEKIAFNGKDKLRAGLSKKLEIGPDDYKRLQDLPIAGMGTLRMHLGGYLARKQGAEWDPVAPDGANPKGPSSYTALWASATAVLQKTRDSKSAGAIRTADLYAILPAGTRDEAIASFLEDEHNFMGAGEKDEAASFDERMTLLIGVAGSVAGAPGARLQQVLLSPMETINQQLSAGISHYSDLQRGLQYAAVSDKAYPNDDRQKKARAALRDKLAWLEQRVAILKALAAGEQWDAFLDKYGDFDRWESSFEELQKVKDKAYQESASQHKAEGLRLDREKQFARALQELKLAQGRNPGDPAMAALVEHVGIEEARDYSNLVRPQTLDPTSAQQITRYLANAETYIGIGKLKEAGDELAKAEALDPSSPRIMLVRAKLLQAGKELQKALEMLDNYTRRVTSQDDIDKGEVLRSSILIQLQSTRETLKAAIVKAVGEGDYVAAMSNAEQGLTFDPQDLDFLLHAGTNGLILRRNAEAQKWLQRYLQVSQGPGNDAKLRTEVLNLSSVAQMKTPEPDGKPNWFSGYKSPPGLFYCPQSLAPNARIVDIKGPRGLSVAFDWTQDALMKVQTTEQNAQHAPVSSTVYFDYFKDRKGVRRVGTEPFAAAEDPGTPRFTPAGPVGAGKGTYVALPNHPVVDPLMVERLTGKPVATIVAGNPYFNPFVWSGVYSFLAEYDEQGRVKSARQIGVEAGQKPHEFDFKWDGLRLIEIAERGGSGYRRTMTYNGNKIVGETIFFGGKPAKIEYKYQGDLLVEASSGDDASIDGRSRHVVFR
jgi:hypothetical protein